MPTQTVQQFVDSMNNRPIWSVHPGDSVHHAVRLMTEKEVGALVVVDDNLIVGILSERDCARRLVQTDTPAREIPVRDFMTTHVLYVRPEQTLDDCLALMSAKRIRHLPVMKDDRILGLISLRDIARTIISTQHATIQKLENYIVSILSDAPPKTGDTSRPAAARRPERPASAKPRRRTR